MPEYTSPGLRSAVVLDNSTHARFDTHAASAGYGSGYIPRDWDDCFLGYAAPVFDLPLIPEDEINDRIKELDEKQQTLDHFAKAIGLNSPSQGQTNSCWAYAGTQAMRYTIARQTGVVLDLCPTSTICMLTNFSNVGGWSSRFVEGVSKFGINTTAEWPRNSFSRQNAKPEVLAKAKTRIAVEFRDFPSRGLSAQKRGQYLATALLLGVPVAAGYNWMSHAVMMKRLALKDGKRVVIADNSGLYRDSNGETVFSWEHSIYDDAVCCPVMRINSEDLK